MDWYMMNTSQPSPRAADKFGGKFGGLPVHLLVPQPMADPNNQINASSASNVSLYQRAMGQTMTVSSPKSAHAQSLADRQRRLKGLGKKPVRHGHHRSSSYSFVGQPLVRSSSPVTQIPKPSVSLSLPKPKRGAHHQRSRSQVKPPLRQSGPVSPMNVDTSSRPRHMRNASAPNLQLGSTLGIPYMPQAFVTPQSFHPPSPSGSSTSFTPSSSSAFAARASGDAPMQADDTDSDTVSNVSDEEQRPSAGSSTSKPKPFTPDLRRTRANSVTSSVSTIPSPLHSQQPMFPTSFPMNPALPMVNMMNPTMNMHPLSTPAGVAAAASAAAVAAANMVHMSAMQMNMGMAMPSMNPAALNPAMNRFVLPGNVPVSSRQPTHQRSKSAQMTSTRNKKPAKSSASSDGKRFACHICDKRFHQSSNLITHIRTHTGERPYECETCGRRFTQSSNLITHIRTHTGERPYECETCGRRFTQSSNLRRHMRTHTGEKPFQCEVCGKKCSRKGSLITHMRIHTGEKPFQCKVCGKRFSIRGSLTMHLRIHSGERPFQCEKCGKTFPRRSELTRHIKSHGQPESSSCKKSMSKPPRHPKGARKFKLHVEAPSASSSVGRPASPSHSQTSIESPSRQSSNIRADSPITTAIRNVQNLRIGE